VITKGQKSDRKGEGDPGTSSNATQVLERGGQEGRVSGEEHKQANPPSPAWQRIQPAQFESSSSKPVESTALCAFCSHQHSCNCGGTASSCWCLDCR
jgi:hypothetical protein